MPRQKRLHVVTSFPYDVMASLYVMTRLRIDSRKRATPSSPSNSASGTRRANLIAFVRERGGPTCAVESAPSRASDSLPMSASLPLSDSLPAPVSLPMSVSLPTVASLPTSVSLPMSASFSESASLPASASLPTSTSLPMSASLLVVRTRAALAHARASSSGSREAERLHDALLPISGPSRAAACVPQAEPGHLPAPQN
ncbi:hypothetical protein DFH11DRAFT_1605558 [Phellopilus nigrolimitatus]|nr:hypothetical protein DFH11DRAFT_1605558 [Phellopilus nigrolimitatus]